ncbi:DUF2927 domain-containing protein [Actibacterium sp.]|uniref:DUF2927 domain-containing protein n=1 Tax=Actibacterium sp. TaxID=1872125 RepID=UPI0035638FCD
MTPRRTHGPLTALALALGLSACQMGGTLTSATAPQSRPDMTPAVQSAQSKALESYYARVETDLLTRGLVRSDGGGPDTPFSQRQLVENFVQIALYNEYDFSNGILVPRKSASRLRRWSGPVRMSVSFGETVPAEKRRKDMNDTAAYARRLTRLTGNPVTLTSPANANFHVLFLNEDERRALGPQLQTLVPGVTNSLIRSITDMPRSTFCTVYAFSLDDASTYYRAVAVIRAEQPDLLRLTCIHEELAQGMGLANDSPAARPSIFNDDEEFALLTYHDELLLRMLYDPRLTPGMTAEQARPILRDIASDLMGGSS